MGRGRGGALEAAGIAAHGIRQNGDKYGIYHVSHDTYVHLGGLKARGVKRRNNKVSVGWIRANLKPSSGAAE